MKKTLVKIAVVLAIIALLSSFSLFNKIREFKEEWHRVGFATYIAPKSVKFDGDIATFSQICDSPHNIFNPQPNKLKPSYEVKIGKIDCKNKKYAYIETNLYDDKDNKIYTEKTDKILWETNLKKGSIEGIKYDYVCGDLSKYEKLQK